MESKDWSGFGYFSPDLEKIKQLVVCFKRQNTWEDTGDVVKVFFSIQSKKKNVRQRKKTELSTPFVVKAAFTLEKLQIYYPCDPTIALIPKTSKISPVSLAFFIASHFPLCCGC